MTIGPNPLCVALDDVDPDACRKTAQAVAPFAGTFKIAATAFASGGPRLVVDVGQIRPVFVDLKLHDIPAQVAGAVKSLARLGARYATVHASGGEEMLRAASDAAGDEMSLLAVTVLTSLDDTSLRTIGVARSCSDHVIELAELSRAAGIRGLVCSAHELTALRQRWGRFEEGGPFLVVPGIRTDAPGADDQRRTMAPSEALARGADMLVVGRPITTAPDPATAAGDLLRAITS